MVTPTETRRRVLQAAGLAAAGLAGCAGTPGRNDPTASESATTAEQPATTTEQPATATATPTEQETTDPPTSSATPSSPVPTPHGPDRQHLHGTMVIRINGRTYHFGDKPWNVEERTGIYPFHFHTDGERDTWHVHALDVTLGYAVDTMPRFEVAPPTIAFRGHGYDGSQPDTSIYILSNGDPIEVVDRYVLRDGDSIEFVVETDAPTPTASPTEAS